MNVTLKAVAALLSLSVVASCVAAQTTGPAPAVQKYVIYSGWGNPDTGFVREHWKEMDQKPFNGTSLLIRIDPAGQKNTANDLGWNLVGPKRFTIEDFQFAREDMKGVAFKNLTRNFLTIQLSSGYTKDLHWYEDARWAVLLDNAKMFAQLARELGCLGIVIDCEHYGYGLFNYESMKGRYHQASYAEYCTKAKERGAQFAQALNAGYPDIPVYLFYYGWCVPVREGESKMAPAPEKRGYSLLLPFLDGMLKGSSPKTTFVDGYEYSYGFRSAAAFDAGRKQILEGGLQITSEPDRYRRQVVCGFGLWIDNDAKWDRKDFENNFFTPVEWENSLALALRATDGYVWVYSHHAQPFAKDAVPAEYFEAMRKAEADYAKPDWSPRPAPRSKPFVTAKSSPILKTEDYVKKNPRFENDKLFAEFANEFVADLPKVWKFKTDPKQEGDKLGFAAADYKDADWRSIEINMWWEEQIKEAYDGWAWYRCTFQVPATLKGKEIALIFGAVDESAWLYLNGKPAGEHDIGPLGWDQPFVITLDPKLVKFGEPNVLAVKVFDSSNLGGIWRAVKLAVKK